MIKVGYNGIKGAYSYEACMKMIPDAQYIGYEDFSSCFENLQNDIIDFTVLPIENSYAGRVADIHRLIVKYDIYIHAEVILPIKHQLLANNGAQLADLQEIYSHEQAIWQCEITLKKLFREKYNREIKFRKYHDTAMAAEFIFENKLMNVGAIASATASKIYNLQIVQPDINDLKDNYTNFILLSKKPNNNKNEPEKRYISSIIFEVSNKSGSLYEILNIFSQNAINLRKLESYIPGAIKSDYAKFFITIDGHVQNETIASALKKIEQKLPKKPKYLGSYIADSLRF